jgi:hypothetical protein
VSWLFSGRHIRSPVSSSALGESNAIRSWGFSHSELTLLASGKPISTGRRIVYEAQGEQGDWNVYTQLVAGSPPVRITRARNSYPAISPDEKTVALREERGGISLYPADGGQPVALKGSSDADLPMRFASGGKSLLVLESTGRELLLTLIDVASGRRDLWKRIPAESRAAQFFAVTPDLKYYAYPFPRYSSVLYTVENLR